MSLRELSFSRRWAAILLALILSKPSPVTGEMDTLELSLSSDFADPVVWLNVEGPPYWADGVKPRYWVDGPSVKDLFRDRPHYVELEPGASVRLTVPPNESVLVRGEARALDAIEWAESNGSGLWAAGKAVATDDPRARVLPASIWSTRLVEIRRPERVDESDTAEAFRLALYVSRRDPGVNLGLERRAIWLDAPRRFLALGIEPQPGPLHELRPGNEVQVEVEGPRRYLLEHRLFFPEELSDRRWSYRVELRAGTRRQESEFVAFPQVRDLSLVSGRTHAVGRRFRSYIDVEEGIHTLTIRTDAPLLARLIGPFDEMRARMARRLTEQETGSSSSAWLSDDQAIEAAATGDPRSNAHQRALLRIARDNRKTDAGLLAADRAIEEARAMGDLSPLRRFAIRLTQGQMSYRGLLADAGSGLPGARQESRSYRFVTSRLRSPYDDRDRYVLSEQHTDSVRRLALSGRFDPLPEDGSPLHVPVPERPADSLIRLAVQPPIDAESRCRIEVLFDTGERIHLRAGPHARSEELAIGAPEVATSLQNAAGKIPGEVPGLGWSSATSSIELTLPQATGRISIAAQECAQRRIALAYATGRTDRMNEAEYRAAEQAIGGSAASRGLFLAALRHLDAVLDGDGSLADAVGDAAGEGDWQRAASARLLNHWIPALRKIRARSIDYAHDRSPIHREPSPPLSPADASALRDRAETFEKRGDLLSAYQSWMRLARATDAPLAMEARSRSLDALVATGYAARAVEIARADFLHAEDEAIRDASYQRLARLHRARGDELALAGLFATRALRAEGDRQAEAISRHADLALAQGDDELALTLEWILPPELRDLERRAEAAYLRGWWIGFGETLEALPEPAANRWRGYQAQHRGDFSDARAHWRNADASGQAALESLELALEIRDELVDGSEAERRRALRRWAHWRPAVPGRRVWKSARNLIVDGDGGALLQARSVGLHARWLRASPERPIRLRVVGPSRLRIDARPTLDPADAYDETNWLEVRSWDRAWRLPLSKRRWSTGLEVAGHPEQLVGTRSSGVLELDEGIHELEVLDPGGPVLIQLREERPQLELDMLPPLGPNALDWLEGHAPHAPRSEISCLAIDRSGLCSRSWRLLPKAGGPTETIRDPNSIFPPSPGEIRPEGSAKVEPPPRFPSSAERAWPLLQPIAELHPQGDRPDPTIDLGTGLAEVTRNLWLIEERDRETYRLLARIGGISAAHPRDPLMQRLWRRTMSSFEWRRVRQATSSAGIRVLARAVGAPSAPGSRVSWTLLDDTCQESARLSETGDLVLELSDPDRSEVTLELSLCSARAREPEPIQAKLAIDGASPTGIELGAARRRLRETLRLAPGAHRIRIEASRVPSGQTLGIRVIEDGRSLIEPRDRAYHVAKPDRPVVFELPGPGLVRIDAFDGESSHTSYRPLEEASNRIELGTEGANERFYRVYRASRLPASREEERRAEPGTQVPYPPVRIASLAPSKTRSADGSKSTMPEGPRPMDPADPRSPNELAGPEDGTWSLSAAYQSRTVAVDEPRPSYTEHFGELRGTHRFFHEERALFSRNDLFIRPREDGGPTLGARSEWTWPSVGIWRGLQAGARFDALAQPPTGGPDRLEALLGGRFEAALPHALSGTVRQRPSLLFFGRYLTLSDRDGYPRENIDRDVFTPYKADHRYGLRIEEELSYRPYRDWLTKLDVSVQTNEDFNPVAPDRVSIGGSAAMLYEALQLQAGYRWRHYFSDDDRNGDIDRHDLRFSLVMERWMPRARRWELRVDALHELSRETTQVRVRLTFHLGKDRGFRDFAPESVRFRAERDLTRRRRRPRIGELAR